MFEALIYDERDRNTDYPGSYLGEYETRISAVTAVAEYLTGVGADMPVYAVRILDRRCQQQEPERWDGLS